MKPSDDENSVLLTSNADDIDASDPRSYIPEVSPTLVDPEVSYELAPVTTRELHDLAYLQEVVDLPQGRHLGVFAVTVNFVSRIVGSGIFAVPGLMYQDVGGSPALFFLVWFIAAALSFAGLYVYLEMGSLISKNGGTKTFLEFIFYKPKMLTTVMVGIFYILFGFVISNSLVFGQYFLYCIGVDSPSDSSLSRVGLVLIAVSLGIHSLSVKGGTFIQNLLGALKSLLIIAMALAGAYALLPQSVTSIENQLIKYNFFATKHPVTIAGFTSLLFKAFFTMAGWNSVHTLAGEIEDPIRTMKISGPLSLIIVSVCYLFINLAYLIVIPSEELLSRGELVGSLLFERIFGSSIGRRFLTMSVAVSAGGNVFVVMYSCARMNQEVFREGFLPFSRFFSSNSRFGTPIPSLCIVCVISSLFLIMPSRGNLYDYIVNLESYPGQFFIFLVAIGIFIMRKRYPELKAPIRASLFATALLVIFSVFLLIGPLVPSKGEKWYMHKGYPNYGITSCIFFTCCATYWYVKFRLLPRLGEYQLVLKDDYLDDGLAIKVWQKVYK